MVGNDVVDLRDAESDPARGARFDARVCTVPERRAIASAADPSLVRWSLWAAKEAGYKLLRKRVPDVIFSPVRFEVTLDAAPGATREAGRRAGVVRHGGHSMSLAIEYAEGAVHALATWPGDPGDGLLIGLERLVEAPARPDVRVDPARLSAAVRALAIGRLAARLHVPAERLAIVKRDRIPGLQVDGAPSGADLSLSHHGDVVAFACRLPAMPSTLPASPCTLPASPCTLPAPPCMEKLAS